jgi:hypothetical protein
VSNNDLLELNADRYCNRREGSCPFYGRRWKGNRLRSIMPMSPVWNHPLRNASAVASGRFIVALHHICSAYDNLAARAPRNLFIVIVKQRTSTPKIGWPIRPGFDGRLYMIKCRERWTSRSARSPPSPDIKQPLRTQTLPQPASVLR